LLFIKGLFAMESTQIGYKLVRLDYLKHRSSPLISVNEESAKLILLTFKLLILRLYARSNFFYDYEFS